MATPLRNVAFRNVRLHWRQSLAALASISAGFVSLSLFQGYMVGVNGLYEEVFSQRGMLGHVLVERRGAQQLGFDDAFRLALTPQDQATVEAYFAEHADQVANQVRFLQVTGTLALGRTNTIFGGFGYDLEAGARMRRPTWEWNTLAGVPLERKSGPEAIVLGQSLGQILGCAPIGAPEVLDGKGGYRPNERPFECPPGRLQVSVTTHAGQLNALDVSVAGMVDAVFKEVDTRYAVMSLPTAQKLLDTQSISSYSVALQRTKDIPDFIAGLRAFATARGLELDVLRWQDHKVGDMFVRTMSFLGLFRNFVVAVILAIVTLSILNTLVKIVTGRIREIGTLRSLGFRRRQVASLFAMEAALLATLGNAVGVGITLVLSGLVNAFGISYRAGLLSEPVPFRIAFDWKIYALSAVFLWFIAVGTALFAVHGALRRRVSDNLIHA